MTAVVNKELLIVACNYEIKANWHLIVHIHIIHGIMIEYKNKMQKSIYLGYDILKNFARCDMNNYTFTKKVRVERIKRLEN